MEKIIVLVIAFSGLGLTIWGRWLKTYSLKQQHLFLWGAVLLGVSAVLDFEPVLIVFECIIVLGCILGFFEFKANYKYTAIGLAAVIGIALLLTTSQGVTGTLVLGLLGLVLGSAGFATRSAKIQVLSSSVLVFYNVLQFSGGNQVSAVFAILNFTFAIFAVRSLKAVAKSV